MLENGEGLSDPSRMPPAFIRSEWFSRTDLHPRSAMDYVGCEFHGLTVTHLDGPCHYFWDGQMYNGASATLVSTAFGPSTVRSQLRFTEYRAGVSCST